MGIKKDTKLQSDSCGTVKLIFLIIGVLILIFTVWLFVGEAPRPERIIWGVSFSQKQAKLLGIPWKENYLALLYDLKVPALKIIAYWDLIESKPDEYFFEDLDFQIEEAEEKGVEVILVFGRKVPRWPECHIPDWAGDLSEEKQEERILKLIEEIVVRYHDSEVILAWQVENEPFFRFGKCPKITEKFLKEEINLVKLLDLKNRPIIITDSGSNRFWFRTARLGDKVGISLYRKVWFEEFNSYVKYPFPPVFYWRKSQIIEKLFGKEIFCGELQAEPWGPVLIHELPLEEQQKTMDLEQFQKNIEFAKKTGFKEFYLWGSEWWYWLKTKHNQPEIWEEAGKLFN